MSDIIRARELIEAGLALLSDAHPASAKFRRALALMTRDPPVRRAHPHSRPMTTKIAAAVRRYARDNPGAPFTDIAAHFDVNPGRVSEVLNGKTFR